MRFEKTPIMGAHLVEYDAHEDERGFFTRMFCDQEFAEAGIEMAVPQVNLSYNRRALTLRGMHYQDVETGESKVVSCVRGRIFDAVIDLRADSPTFKNTFSATLSPAERKQIYIPPGCAHGFLTLEDDSDVLYLMGTRYLANAGCGVRWNDPAFSIPWPATPAVISDRDATYADFVG